MVGSLGLSTGFRDAESCLDSDRLSRPLLANETSSEKSGDRVSGTSRTTSADVSLDPDNSAKLIYLIAPLAAVC